MNKIVYLILGFCCVLSYQSVFLSISKYELKCPNEPIANTPHSVTIVHDKIRIDGKRVQIISGSIHYFRIPYQYWRDRLGKAKAAGLNTITTAVDWSFHEPEKGMFLSAGDHDVAKFIEIAAEEGLWVILRPGPYIGSDRELGGIPYWLLKDSIFMRLRTNNKSKCETKRWIDRLFKEVGTLLAGNGGPIIMVQVESEYGKYGHDKEYLNHLRSIIGNHVKNNALLYTTDELHGDRLHKGHIPGTLTTMAFAAGTHVTTAMDRLRMVNVAGPLMNSKFYIGRPIRWGAEFYEKNKKIIINTLSQMLLLNVHVNMYMFAGGTNFGFSTGASFSDTFKPRATSYDYDAPLNEAGDPTPKYFAIRKLLQKYVLGLENCYLPKPSLKGAYGEIKVEPILSLLSQKGRYLLGKRYRDFEGSSLPMFEKLKQGSGLILYEIDLEGAVRKTLLSNQMLTFPRPRDSAYVYINNKFKAAIYRMLSPEKVSVLLPPDSQEGILSLLVENQGRISFGPEFHDFKGIPGDIRWGVRLLQGNWRITGFPLNNTFFKDVKEDHRYTYTNTTEGPILYRGILRLPKDQDPLDTYLDTSGWGKGYVWINGRNIGRYWPVMGPQITLYVPGVWLKKAPEVNIILILELETHPQFSRTITFLADEILNKRFTIRKTNMWKPSSQRNRVIDSKLLRMKFRYE